MKFKFDKDKHQFIVNGIVYPSITQVLVEAGFLDTRWFDEYSATRGTYVHTICEWHERGTLDESSIDDEIKVYYEAYLKFRKEKTNYKITEMETPRINETYKFGGIADQFGIMDGVQSVLDIKTGVDVPATRLQTAAQILLADHPILERYSLQLKKDGNYKLNKYPTVENIMDRNIFIASVSSWWWKKNYNLIKKEKRDE